MSSPSPESAPPDRAAPVAAGEDLRRPGRHPGYGSGVQVWLLRHAAVAEEWQGRVYGGLDVPLSEAGLRETERITGAFGRLAFFSVTSSPLERARLLGEGLARRAGAPFATDAGLEEIDRGSWRGRTVAELREEQAAEIAALDADPWSWRGHGGEADADVIARAWPVLERALRAAGRGSGPRAIALVSHYNVTRNLIARALGLEPRHSFRLRVDTGGATLLVDALGGWELWRSNVRSPLDDGGSRADAARR